MQFRLLLALVAAGALIAAPTTAAEPTAQADNECSEPPCGWIAPLLDLLIEDKPACSGGYILGGELDPSECMTPPQEGQPLVMEGEFRLYWELCEEATYLNDVQDPIEVSFSSTNRNPSFLKFQMEPSSFTLDTATLLNPQYIVLGEKADGSPTCWYDYRQPITLTFTREGEPSEADIETIQNQNCVAQYYIKMQSDESGERFKSGWGIEPFRFHMLNDPLGESLCNGGSKSTPAVAAPVLLGGLAALGVALRRY